MRPQAQISTLFHLDKCIGCHTCSVACKNLWTDRRGAEYMWWNNVETRPGTGYPTGWEDQSHYGGGWRRDARGRLKLRLSSRTRGLANLFYNPKLPELEDYYEPFTFRYEDLFTAPESDEQPTAIPVLTDHREAHGDRDRPQLGRRSLRLEHLRQTRSGTRRGSRRRSGTARRDGARGLQLPAADLQPLLEPRLRRRVPQRRDLQTGRGRGGAGQREQMPRLADVRGRVPLQEGLLQLGDRQVGEVHPLFPTSRDRAGARLHPLLRRPHPLHGSAAVRRRSHPRRCRRGGRGSGRRPARHDPGSLRPAR